MNEIDARFEMELAYYEMCAEETISNLLITESEGSQSVVKKIWSAIKSAVKKIFDALSNALSKIAEKFSKLIHGKSLKDDANELKKAISSAPKEVQNANIEVNDIESMMKINSEARKEVQNLQRDIQSGKKVTADEIDDKMKKYKEKMGNVKKKGKIKTSVKVAIAGAAAVAAAIPFIVNKANARKSMNDEICPVSQSVINAMCDKAEKQAEKTSEDVSKPTPGIRIIPREHLIGSKPTEQAHQVSASKLSPKDAPSVSSGETGSAIVKLSNYNAEVAKDAVDVAAKTSGNVRKAIMVLRRDEIDGMAYLYWAPDRDNKFIGRDGNVHYRKSGSEYLGNIDHNKSGMPYRRHERDIARSTAYDKNIFNTPRRRPPEKFVDFKRPNYEEPDPDWEERLAEQERRREERRKAKEGSE